MKMNYLSFVLNSLKQETIAGYKNYSLGNLWLFIQPLTMMTIYIIVFGHLFQQKLLINIDENPYSYTIYICSGLIFWNFFVDVFSRFTNLYLKYSYLLKKVSIPLYTFFFIEIFASIFNFIIFLILFLIFLFFVDLIYVVNFYYLLIALFLTLLLGVTMGFGLGIVNIFIRDVGYAVGIILQLWFWITPIIYPTSIIPDYLKEYLLINPFLPIINTARSVFSIGSNSNIIISLIYPILISLVFIFFAITLLRINRKLIKDFL